jgi:hypothetical protein
MAQDSAEKPASLTIARALFILNGVIWILFGLFGLYQFAASGEAQGTSTAIIALIMFANASLMIGLGFAIGKGKKRLYYLAIAVLLINIILTVTDEFGIFDFATLLIDVVLLALLIATRSRYDS